MNRRKLALAAATAVLPVSLWASPAAATMYEEVLYTPEDITTADGTRTDMCAPVVTIRYDDVAHTIYVHSWEEHTSSWCRHDSNETAVYVSYLDASGERHTLASWAPTSVTIERAGIVSDVEVTATRFYYDCQVTDASDCRIKNVWSPSAPK